MFLSADQIREMDDDELVDRFDLPPGAWAPLLLKDLADQANEREIPVEDLPALARNLDRLDYDRLMVNVSGAAEMLGLSAPYVAKQARDAQGLWNPTVVIFDDQGNATVKLWIARKLEALDTKRRRASHNYHRGWIARKRREREGKS